MPSRIDFVSHAPTIKDSVVWGPVDLPLHAVIVYQRSTDAAYLGDPLVVEFSP